MATMMKERQMNRISRRQRAYHASILLVGSIAAMTSINDCAAFTTTLHIPSHLPSSHSSSVRQGVALDASAASDSGLPSFDPKFIRLLPRAVRGSRQSFEVQTAVTAFERAAMDNSKEQVELHALLHFASSDYFEYFSSDEFQRKHDNVLFELVVDKSLLLEEGTKEGFRRLRPSTSYGDNVLMASPTDRQTGSQYGLKCQVDNINYAQPNWIHADLSRQEILDEMEITRHPSSSLSQEPIWALASTAPTWPGAEAILALVRPSTPATPLSSPVTRRLFSNLFLPGDALAGLLRALFWVTVPSPELSVMLLDWSSILPRPTGGVSQVALPVVESLLTGNIREARQLIFGQMLVSGQSSSVNEKVLIGKRNEHAINVLMKSLEQHTSRGLGETSRQALLYGAMHCPDLYRRLLARGFRPTKTQWRTAWSVQVPSFGTGVSNNGSMQSFASTSSPAAIAIGLVILPTYFTIGGLDWIATLGEVATSATGDGSLADACFVLGLYLVRHVVLYLGLAKFVVDWDGGMNLFGNDDSTR